MSGPGPTRSPWGEPARMPQVTATLPRTANPQVQPHSNRWEQPARTDRARAALTMVFVAIILGAAAAVVLGVGVWALAALFHHAASG